MTKAKLPTLLPYVALVLALALVGPAHAEAGQRPAAAAAGPFRVVSIHATGSQRFPEADVVATTGLKIGDSIMPEQLKSVADKLAATGAFEEISYKYGPAGAGISVDFKVGDAAQFLPVSFDNFVWFADQQLTDAIRGRVPLFHGAVPPDGEMLPEVTDALQALLAEKGIPGQVKFQLKEERLGAPIHGGAFSIEGVNIRIKNVEFPGAAPEDIPLLEAASKELLQLSYDRSTAENFAQLNLRPVYLQRGYLKATFSDPQTKLISSDAKDPVIDLLLPVTRGLQYRLGALRWTGNKAMQSIDLDKLLTLHVGQPADVLALGQDLELVHDRYTKHGYLRQSTREVPSFDDSVQVVSYELQVNEGDQYRFAGVEVEGLTAQMRARVREVWALREGEPFDPSYIKVFLHAAAPVLGPGVITRVEPEINDKTKTVEITIHFEYQKQERAR